MKNYLKLAATAAILLALPATVEAQTAKKAAAKPAAAAKSGTRMMAPARLGGKPNLNGVWQVLNGANWDLEPHSAGEAPAAPEKLGAIGAIPGSVGVIQGGTIPYKADAVAKRDENKKGAPMLDPEAACYLPGIPRATYMDHPFQIIQGDNGDILIAYEYASARRVIHMQKVDVPPIDTWMGTSYGQWDGDTLKVTTLAQSPGDVILPGGELKPGVTWLDRAGNYLTNTATVTERFKMVDATHIDYEVTVDDPSVYSKPWKMTMTIYKHVEPNAQLLDFRCVPFADKLLYGDLLPDKDKYPKK